MNEIKAGDVYGTIISGHEFEYLYEPEKEIPWVCIAGDEILKMYTGVPEYRFEHSDVLERIEEGTLEYMYSTNSM